MEWNGVLRHVSTERLFYAENGDDLLFWFPGHCDTNMYDGIKQLGLKTILHWAQAIVTSIIFMISACDFRHKTTTMADMWASCIMLAY